MELFKTLLFGISGLSLIFWAAVIGLWHVDMFPRFFKEDRTRDVSSTNQPSASGLNSGSDFISGGSLRPQVNSIGLFDRAKYSRKSLVIADFSPIDNSYGVNRLYTSMILSIGIMSFILITYGLHSGFTSILN